MHGTRAETLRLPRVTRPCRWQRCEPFFFHVPAASTAVPFGPRRVAGLPRDWPWQTPPPPTRSLPDRHCLSLWVPALMSSPFPPSRSPSWNPPTRFRRRSCHPPLPPPCPPPFCPLLFSSAVICSRHLRARRRPPPSFPVDGHAVVQGPHGRSGRLQSCLPCSVPAGLGGRATVATWSRHVVLLCASPCFSSSRARFVHFRRGSFGLHRTYAPCRPACSRSASAILFLRRSWEQLPSSSTLQGTSSRYEGGPTSRR